MKKYVVIELQTSTEGTVSTLATTYDDYWIAEQAYHTILAAAAASGLPCHAAVILTPTGNILERQSFERNGTNA